MKHIRVIVATAAAASLVAGTAPAFAQSAVRELSSGSSGGSSKPQYYEPAPKLAVPEKRAFEGAYTGSAPLSLALAALSTAAAIQLIVDFVPPVRAAVDDVAAQLGLTHVVGSSEGNRIIPAEDLKRAAREFMEQAGISM